MNRIILKIDAALLVLLPAFIYGSSEYYISHIKDKNIIIDKKNIIYKENKIIINSIDINNKTIYLAIGGEEKN